MTTNLILLADFSVIRPEPGLLIWTIIIFGIFWFLMAKFAFKPIQEALKAREHDIQNSLEEAKRAREEMSQLKAANEDLLAQAREERSKILQEAKAIKENIINEAKEKAREDARQIVASAKHDIENLRMAAVVDLKNQAGNMAIDIAEQLLHRQLAGKAEQEAFVKQLVEESNMN